MEPVERLRQVRLRCCTWVTFFGRYTHEYVIRLRVTDLMKIFYPSTHCILVRVMSLVYIGHRPLHCMDLPSAARRLKANFSGVVAFDSSIYVVANTVFGSHETKNFSGPSFLFSEWQQKANKKTSFCEIKLWMTGVLDRKGFSSGQYRLFIAYFQI